jgi:hypothetical protein
MYLKNSLPRAGKTLQPIEALRNQQTSRSYCPWCDHADQIANYQHSQYSRPVSRRLPPPETVFFSPHLTSHARRHTQQVSALSRSLPSLFSLRPRSVVSLCGRSLGGSPSLFSRHRQPQWLRCRR